MQVFFTNSILITVLLAASCRGYALAVTSSVKTNAPIFKVVQEIENPPGTNIVAFKDWKAEMIETAQARLQISKTNLESYKSMNPSKPSAKGRDSVDLQIAKYADQVQADESYLAFTKDLTISDYFVGYLVKQNNPQIAYKQAAMKLNSDEVAELLSAYATHIKESNAGAPMSQPKMRVPKSASDQLPL